MKKKTLAGYSMQSAAKSLFSPEVHKTFQAVEVNVTERIEKCSCLDTSQHR
jgi:hypothetical protein